MSSMEKATPKNARVSQNSMSPSAEPTTVTVMMKKYKSGTFIKHVNCRGVTVHADVVYCFGTINS